MARLGDVATYINGYAFKPSDWSDTGLPIIRIQDLTGNSYQANRYNGEYAPKYEVNDGDVLISWSASLGVYVWHGEKALLNQHIFKVVFDKTEISKAFFVHQVESILEKAASEAHGATMRHLTKPVFDALPFYLPPLDEQRKIAAALDKVSDLIAKRRQQLDKLDEMVKARFVEMFGDPVCNSKCLPTERGIDFFKLSNGKFVPEGKRFESGIPAYGGNGISWYTDDAILQNDTLVVGRVGFQSGNVHFVKGPLWITDNAMYISNYDQHKYNLLFLWALMEHIDFTRFQDAGDLKKITQKPFMSMEYICPTLSQQLEYVSFAEQTEKSKTTISRSLEKLETLKKALVQEYFG